MGDAIEKKSIMLTTIERLAHMKLDNQDALTFTLPNPHILRSPEINARERDTHTDL